MAILIKAQPCLDNSTSVAKIDSRGKIRFMGRALQLVMEQMRNLENFLTTENLTSSDRLQEVTYSVIHMCF